MGISTHGWGSGAITTFGFGGGIEYILNLVAKSLSNRYAYTCVVTRDYLEVKTRDKGEIILRLKPDSIPIRSGGWPHITDPCIDVD